MYPQILAFVFIYQLLSNLLDRKKVFIWIYSTLSSQPDSVFFYVVYV